MTEYVIHFDIMSSVITFILILAHYNSPFINAKLRRVYMELLVTVFLSCILDIVSSLLITSGGTSEMDILLTNAVTHLYYAIHLLPLCIFVWYVILCIKDYKPSKVVIVLNFLPVIISEVLILTNPITKLLFHYGLDGYIRGPLIFVLYTIGLLYVVVALFILFAFWTRLENVVRIVIVLYSLITFFVIVLQYRFPNLLLECSGMTVALLIVYFTIQNQDMLAEATRRQNELAKAATEANIAKTNFLANMSHEIRTPISTMLGMNQLILKESDSLTIKKYAQDVQSAGDALMSLVDSILDLTRIESGKLNIDNKNYEVETFVREVTNDARNKAITKGIAFNIKIDPMIPKVLCGDYYKLYQIVSNLLNNAVTYTSEGFAEFRVGYERISPSELSLNICVKDTGDGIEASNLSWLSERYKENTKKNNRGIEGSGLGLAIVTELLDLFGARLEVKSKPKVGSEFSFSVKQGIVDNTSLGKVDVERQHVIVEDSSISFITRDVVALLVDDNEMNLYVMRRLLNQYKIKVVSVDNGEDAILASKKVGFDIIFMDYMMPGLDGIEVMNCMKSSENYKSHAAPFIVMTANAIAGIRDKYIGAGFDDFVSKPINQDRLEEILLRSLPRNKIILD